jgi:hypothetical protein
MVYVVAEIGDSGRIATSPGAEFDRLSLPIGRFVEGFLASSTRKEDTGGTRKLTSSSLKFHMGALPIEKRKILEPVI